ncbi:carboxypeptidase-like regulatory domain-containing protein [Pontibacter ummariensis]|nr:carboxypeptidase-like regulatory domain-containing protein [Pontibacter ummariensis]
MSIEFPGRKDNYEMKKLLILFIVFTASICGVYSQSKTIEGRVISEHLETLPGVFIMIDDSVEVGMTDLNGFFKIDIPVSEKKILFKGVGMEPTTIELVDECDKIEVVIMLSSTYDFITPRRVERKRKKRYKKLPEIHKQAYEKGIFKSCDPCVSYVFTKY